MNLELSTLLVEMSERAAFDLHLVDGQPPTFRIDGNLVRRKDGPILDGGDIDALFHPHMNEEQRAAFAATPRREIDVIVRNNGRLFRCHLYHESGLPAAAVRMVLPHIPTLDDLGFGSESAMQALTRRPRGLILVAGPTGCGKETTVAAMIETINRNQPARILIVDDALDYRFTSQIGLVSQRVLGEDFETMAQAARSVLRSDPDVVLLGELRDRETAQIALQLAETGRLVFATIQADRATDGVIRLLELLPDPPATARRAVARNLEAVVGQQLFRRIDRPGRVVAYEILLSTPNVQVMIERGREAELPAEIEANEALGMRSMRHSVSELIRSGTISLEAGDGMEIDPDATAVISVPAALRGEGRSFVLSAPAE